MIHQINEQCGSVDKTWRLNTRQQWDIRWAVKEEGNEQLHQTVAFLSMVAGRWPAGEKRNPPCCTLLQEHSSQCRHLGAFCEDGFSSGLGHLRADFVHLMTNTQFP